MTDTTTPEITGDAPSLEELSGEGVASQEALTTPEPEPKALEAAPEAKPEKEQPFWYRKEIEKERKRAADLERRLQEAESRREQPQAPDPRQDPVAHFEQMRIIDKLERSEDLFIDKHGEDELESVKDWLKTRPDIEARAIEQRRPWPYAHEQYKLARLREEIGDDPAGWQARKEKEIEERLMAKMSGDGLEPNPAMTPSPLRIPAPASSARSAPAKGGYAGPAPLSDLGKNKFG